MIKDKVSIVLPTYNSASTVERAINSVINQTYKNWELIITDDNSSDNTISIINNYIKAPFDIKLYINEVNSGAGFSRNNSIKKASGNFIAFLDSDDYWKNNKLEKQLVFMNKNNLPFSFTSYIQLNHDNSIKKVISAKHSVNFNDILKNNYIGCLTVMYSIDHFGKLYMPNVRKRQDWCLWIDIIKKLGKVYSLEEPLAYYTFQKNSLSSNKFYLIKYNWYVYYHHLNFGLIKSVFCMINYFFFYIIKKI